MLTFIYVWAFITALGVFLCWSLFSDHRATKYFRRVFFLAIAAWALALIFSPVAIGTKASILMRDLLVMGVAGIAMLWARSNLITGLIILAGSGLFLHFSYLKILQSTLVQDQLKYADVEILVDLADVDPGNLISFAERNHAVVSKAFDPEHGDITDLDEYYSVNLPGSASPGEVNKFITDLYRESLIDYAEPNEVVTVSPIIPAQDPGVIQRPALVNDPDVVKQWGFDMLEISDLYQLLNLKSVQPSKVALLAILDTGIDAKHEDLQEAYISSKANYDVDVQGHGTHVAGIAAAVSNNNIGIASFDPAHAYIRITSIKVLSDAGSGSQESIIRGMIEAADLGADVISMSLGGRSNSQKEITYEKAVKYCNDQGAIVVVAAGNSNANARLYAPAKVDGVIAVTAINNRLERAPFSNYVNEIQFAVAAPGDQIYSTYPKNRYQAMSGTSMACPHVSSLVAIMKSIEPSLNTYDIHTILSQTGRISKDSKQTGMIIHPVNAVRSLLD